MPPDALPAEPADVGAEKPVGLAAAAIEHRGLDAESSRWIHDLADEAPRREQSLARLHELLLRVAHSELRRRTGQHPITGPELDDVAHQAAADALVAIIGKLGQFRGESRFTTWAYRFVILEISAKLGRHFWRRPTVALDAEDWDRLPDRFGLDPAEHSQWVGLIDGLHRAVEQELSERQRHVFVAIVLNGVPLDALVVQLGSNRNAIYKTMFDARRKLRAALVADGYLSAAGEPAPGPSTDGASERQETGWPALDGFLATDPRDVGCEQAMQILHVYVELVRDDVTAALAAEQYPGVAAHLAACGPCGEDFHGLLATISSI
jgi:RNA polymerase sigma-70 factor (ECF subfamily)